MLDAPYATKAGPRRRARCGNRRHPGRFDGSPVPRTRASGDGGERLVRAPTRSTTAGRNTRIGEPLDSSPRQPSGSGPDAPAHAVAVKDRDRPDLPEITMVGLARGGDDPRPPSHCHLDRDRSHSSRATVDEDRLAGLDIEQAKTSFTRLTAHAGRG